jgi:hypothetical protein
LSCGAPGFVSYMTVSGPHNFAIAVPTTPAPTTPTLGFATIAHSILKNKGIALRLDPQAPTGVIIGEIWRGGKPSAFGSSPRFSLKTEH